MQPNDVAHFAIHADAVTWPGMQSRSKQFGRDVTNARIRSAIARSSGQRVT